MSRSFCCCGNKVSDIYKSLYTLWAIILLFYTVTNISLSLQISILETYRKRCPAAIFGIRHSSYAGPLQYRYLIHNGPRIGRLKQATAYQKPVLSMKWRLDRYNNLREMYIFEAFFIQIALNYSVGACYNLQRVIYIQWEIYWSLNFSCICEFKYINIIHTYISIIYAKKMRTCQILSPNDPFLQFKPVHFYSLNFPLSDPINQISVITIYVPMFLYDPDARGCHIYTLYRD